jgi:hypothetical protein
MGNRQGQSQLWEGGKWLRVIASFYPVPVELYCALLGKPWTVVARLSGYKAGKA